MTIQSGYSQENWEKEMPFPHPTTILNPCRLQLYCLWFGVRNENQSNNERPTIRGHHGSRNLFFVWTNERPLLTAVLGPMRGRPPEAGRHLYNVVEHLWKMSNYTWKTTLKTIFVVFFHFIMVLLDGLSANHPKFASYIASSKFRYLESNLTTWSQTMSYDHSYR